MAIRALNNMQKNLFILESKIDLISWISAILYSSSNENKLKLNSFPYPIEISLKFIAAKG